jgi:hypothetical protein
MGDSPVRGFAAQPAAEPTPEALEPTQRNLVTFHSTDVGPPSPLYVGLNDKLFVEAIGGLAGGGQLTIDIRYLLPNGQIQVQQEVVNSGTSYGIAPATFGLAEGFLLSVNARITNAAVTRGQIFVYFALLRSIGIGTSMQLTLSRGYASVFSPVCWPAIPSDFPAQRPGGIINPVISNPSAGTDWSITVPNFMRWRLMAARAQLVTSATAANRQVILRFGPSPNFVFQAMSQAVQAASLTWNYSWATGITSFTAATGAVTPNMNIATPGDLWLAAGQVIGSGTQNIQAGDQWSNIFIQVEECIDG